MNVSPTNSICFSNTMQHTLVTEIRELIYPEDRPRFDEIVYRRYTTGTKATSTTTVPATSTTSRIDHYDTRHVSGKVVSLNYQFFSFFSTFYFSLCSSSFHSRWNYFVSIRFNQHPVFLLSLVTIVIEFHLLFSRNAFE